MTGSVADRDRLVGELKRTKKYGSVCAEALERFAERALERYPTRRAALDAAKRKLHQAFGAYLADGGFGRAAALLAGWPDELGGDALAVRCEAILRCHASTAERLPFARELYRAILARVPAPRVVVDLACGLHPFARPLMGLPAACRVEAVDLDERLAALLNEFFARTSLPGAARCADLLAPGFRAEADVILLFKALPSLERQETGAVRRLLGRLQAPLLVVSFPTRSLGGRDKGMEATYRAAWLPVFAELGFRVEEAVFPAELIFFLQPG